MYANNIFLMIKNIYDTHQRTTSIKTILNTYIKYTQRFSLFLISHDQGEGCGS